MRKERSTFNSIAQKEAHAKGEYQYLGHVCKKKHIPPWRYTGGGRCCACDADDRAKNAVIRKAARLGEVEVPVAMWTDLWSRLYIGWKNETKLGDWQ